MPGATERRSARPAAPAVDGLLVVADTTPLLYLARIHRLDLLARLFLRVVVPGQVWAELIEARPDAPGVDAIRAAAWLTVDRRADESRLAVTLQADLDPGEAAAIALAVECDADVLLIDDFDGRRVARSCGLTIRGTVGVLIAAQQAGLIDRVRPALRALMAEGFRLDRDLYGEVLATVGEVDADVASERTGQDD